MILTRQVITNISNFYTWSQTIHAYDFALNWTKLSSKLAWKQFHMWEGLSHH